VSTKTQTKTSSTKSTAKTPIKSSSTKSTEKKGSAKEIALKKIRLAASRDDGAYEYDDWVPVQMGFAELYQHLNPEMSEVDKVCKYILDQNIPIRFLNVLYNDKCANAVQENLDEIKEKCPNFRNFRFVNGLKHEDGIIKRLWKTLIREADVQFPQDCFQQFSELKKVKTDCEKSGNKCRKYRLNLVRKQNNLTEKSRGS
jgi:hypothetical protein